MSRSRVSRTGPVTVAPFDVRGAALPGPLPAARDSSRLPPVDGPATGQGAGQAPCERVRSAVHDRSGGDEYSSPMPESKETVIATLRDVAAASVRARAAMSQAERGILEGVHRLEAGAEVMEALGGSQVREHREELEAALRLVVSSRQRFRVVMVAQCVEAGLSAREIAELWGFSRQRRGRPRPGCPGVPAHVGRPLRDPQPRTNTPGRTVDRRDLVGEWSTVRCRSPPVQVDSDASRSLISRLERRTISELIFHSSQSSASVAPSAMATSMSRRRDRWRADS